MSASRGFRILPSYYEAIRDLPDADRLILWDAVMGYGCAGIKPENLSPTCRAVFTLMQPTIEKSVQYFISQQEKAQGRQDSIRQKSGTVPAQCQGGADANTANVTGTVRDSGVIGDGDVMNDSGVAVSGDITVAAALLKSLEIHDDKELIETVAGDLQRHGVEIVSEALKHAKVSDTFGKVTSKYYVKTLMEVLNRYKPHQSLAQQGYQARNYTPRDFKAMEVDLDAEIGKTENSR